MATVATFSQASATSATFSLSVPSGTVNGDLLVIIVGSDWDTLTNNGVPAGFTQLTTSKYDGGLNAPHIAVGWRTASSEPASYTVPEGGTSDNAAVMLRITGASSPPTITEVAGSAVANASTTAVAPGLTPAGPDDLLICAAVADGTSGPTAATLTWTPPGGMTESGDVQSPDLFTSTTVAWQSLTSAAATGTRTFTPSVAMGPGGAVSLSIRSAISGAVSRYAAPGKTWKRRFQHHLQRQPDIVVSQSPTVTWLPGLSVPRRSLRKVPTFRTNSGTDVPDGSQLLPSSPKRGTTRRGQYIPVRVEGDVFSPPFAQVVAYPSTPRRTRRVAAILRRVRAWAPAATLGRYQRAVAADTPSVWWRLDEGQGTSFYDCGYLGASHTAAITGGVTLGQSPLAIYDVGSASAFFDIAQMSYGEVLSHADFSPTNLSVDCLFQAPRSANPDGWTGNHRLIAYGADTSWALYINAAHLEFAVFGHAVASFPLINDAGRHHAAGTYDSVTGTTRVYLDGVQVGTQTGTPGGVSAAVDPLRIAQKPTGGTFADGWPGTLDEVALYTTTLTATQVAAHAAAAGFAQPLPPDASGTGRVRRYAALVRRGHAVTPTPGQAAAPAAPSWVPGLRTVRRLTRNRPRAALGAPVAAQDTAPGMTRRPRAVVASRRSRGGQSTAPQAAPIPTVARGLRIIARTVRRAGIVTLTRAQQNPPIIATVFGRLRTAGRIQPRPRVSSPTPAQQAAAANPRITATVFGRLRTVGRIQPRPRIVKPIPAQVNPPIVQTVFARLRTVGRIQPRARINEPTPAQQAAVPNPRITQTVFGRLRTVGRTNRIPRIVKPIPAQVNPPYPVKPSRVVAFRGLSRRRGASSSSPQVQPTAETRTVPIGGLRGLRRIWLKIRRKNVTPVPGQVTTLQGPLIITDSYGGTEADRTSNTVIGGTYGSTGSSTVSKSSSGGFSADPDNDNVSGTYDSDSDSL